ncbi:unnamed protein product, partial [Thlaspi arvense]
IAPDACRCSTMSKPIKMLADSDDVWGVFLPSDYQQIILRSATPVVYSCLKQLYLRLSDSPILLDGANLSFVLEKESGKKCLMLGARNLQIVWGDTSQYWRWMSVPRSRQSEDSVIVTQDYLCSIPGIQPCKEELWTRIFSNEGIAQLPGNVFLPHTRRDGWLEIELGNFSMTKRMSSRLRCDFGVGTIHIGKVDSSWRDSSCDPKRIHK